MRNLFRRASCVAAALLVMGATSVRATPQPVPGSSSQNISYPYDLKENRFRCERKTERFSGEWSIHFSDPNLPDVTITYRIVGRQPYETYRTSHNIYFHKGSREEAKWQATMDEINEGMMDAIYERCLASPHSENIRPSFLGFRPVVAERSAAP